MSTSTHDRAPRSLRRSAPVFAALGDPTRLALLSRLSGGRSLSITRLCEDSEVTRQAITKHLRVLQHAGLVRSVRSGRESLFRLAPEPLEDARRAIDGISRQWDVALAKLKALVEKDAS
jgi:DNA-binding transcriptional ArsR family regulator